ncbi:MAG: DMT family protein [Pirellulaceae bacterium]
MTQGILCVVGLVLSNIFMTMAWYWHLKGMENKAWYLAALVSWGIALFEYGLQVPSNRIGHQVFTIPQLKIMQEAITLMVFIPIAIWVLKERPSINYVVATGFILVAVYFVFWEPIKWGKPASPSHLSVSALGQPLEDIPPR